MKLKTVLGDALKFRGLAASEELGRLFDFSVLALSDADNEVDTAALLGTDAVVTITLGDDSKRHFHGVVARAGLESASGKKIGWRLQLRPWLWKLTRRADSRIFQNMTVEAILKKVFENYPGDVVFELQGSYPPRLYCVQYRETDFNFVSRLMEEEGIYYFHRHTEDKHTLVICDAMTSHADWPGYSTLKYRETQDQLVDLEAITEWRHTYELTPGKVTLNEYDYLKPSTPLKVDHSSVHDTAPPVLEHYDYPGLYTEKARGANLARVRQQELDARVLHISGATTTIGAVAAGFRFTLQDHPLKKENTDHVVVSTRIDAQYAGYESGQGEMQFSCRFRAMRYAHVFRPDRSTPKPVIAGPQTAVVVGPGGEEIYTDEHGRVKVQFHWDRLGTKDDKSSCWVRVASPWAGKAWGMISLPRIGQEVVVDFLEGDPDLPLITSRVYNAEQIPPYKLPEHKTISTIKSRSSVGGAAANFNELAFEDKIGSEWIRLHAEKDLIEVVKHDAHRDVGNDQFLKVGHDHVEEIGHNADLTIGGDSTETVGGALDQSVGQAHALRIGSDQGITVGGSQATSVGSSYSLSVGTGGDISIGTNLGVAAGANVHIKGGANVVIEAGAVLTLKGAMVNLEASGILNINGSMVNINTGGGGPPGSGANPKSPASPKDPKDVKPLTDKIDAVKTDLAQGR
jgi:type VI secretion system secreted protein VgrG